MVSGKAIEGAPVPAMPTSGSGFDGAKGLKELAKFGLLTSIPPTHAFPLDLTASNVSSSSVEEQLPTIDFSFLHAKEATLVNHGVPESLMKGMLDWLKTFLIFLFEVHGETSFGSNPLRHEFQHTGRREKLQRNTLKRVQQISRELFKGISESLGLQSCYIERAFKLEEGLQILICNYYPRCSQPELAMGLTPHSDHGGLAVLMQDEVGGLQLKHKGNWVPVSPLPNTFLVNVGDHLEECGASSRGERRNS
ncbi:probable 2-oxoglutarate/Fe(II)-dependent dioxygenase isoform X2 [Amborella trichopoda]|uniref:probable 2-oxoglutarate/Fe(II)-dependent dioxygenase isoform X2 n=1 Tax=Amborella trichopoda TaxID=13333 RepID=UPI0009C0C388|nr:probable 2-oxoglutarate/Fe(II)-dependent dioxygenase isoform X2 [Amborella trichopoda]|eukprot:XP_020528745.1 probable 2-oxoglutarate/Fe(II)-dependent dioxygenase isoform X2 [Amborella trichopoda]